MRCNSPASPEAGPPSAVASSSVTPAAQLGGLPAGGTAANGAQNGGEAFSPSHS